MTKNLIKSLSLVIPCNNEQDAIKISLKIYMDILKDLLNNKIISSYEVVVVNNGSTDKTLEVLKEQKDNYNIKIVNLKKNYGYTSSYLAGMYHTKNEMIITVSADLHEDPYKIEKMIKEHYSNFNSVLGVYQKRHETFLKNFFSNAYYEFMKILKIPIVKNHADFRLITRDTNKKLFKNLPSFIFLRIKLLEYINSYEKVFYIGSDRRIGKTKFNFISSFILALDTILYYAKINIPKFILYISLIFFIFILITSLVLKMIYVSIFLSIFTLLLSLFYIFISIRIKALKTEKKHFEVKELI
tara:strand:- start:3278 stop:4177 length:900 start_codon:yes stop_codon:yes gene_type:complete